MPSLDRKHESIELVHTFPDGSYVKAAAVKLDPGGTLFQVKVVDPVNVIKAEYVPAHEAYGAIGELVERAAAALRARAKELKGAA